MVNSRKQAYYEQNRDVFAYYKRRERSKVKDEMIGAYGGKCAHCGFAHPDALCLDHINDDPHVEISHFNGGPRGGDRLYQKLKREGWPKDRLQLLCYNCNAIKEMARRRAVNDQDQELEQARALLRKPKSGFRGVYWSNQMRQWAARITVNGKTKHLGFFSDIRDAARARKKAVLALEGYSSRGFSIDVPTDEEIDNFAADQLYQ